MRLLAKNIFIFFSLLGILHSSYAVPSVTEGSLTTLHQHMQPFTRFKKLSDKVQPVKLNQLPPPYHYLLTQPLMTLGIKTYYQQTPIIQTHSAVKNIDSNTYSRIIVMLVSSLSNKNANNDYSIVVEIAFITMNFNALPTKVIDGVLHSHTPFGQLLVENHIKVVSQDRFYFSLPCDQQFASLTHCVLNSKLYGRTNTLIRKDNQQWVAQVVEILPMPRVN